MAEQLPGNPVWLSLLSPVTSYNREEYTTNGMRPDDSSPLGKTDTTNMRSGPTPSQSATPMDLGQALLILGWLNSLETKWLELDSTWVALRQRCTAQASTEHRVISFWMPITLEATILLCASHNPYKALAAATHWWGSMMPWGISHHLCIYCHLGLTIASIFFIFFSQLHYICQRSILYEVVYIRYFHDQSTVTSQQRIHTLSHRDPSYNFSLAM